MFANIGFYKTMNTTFTFYDIIWVILGMIWWYI